MLALPRGVALAAAGLFVVAMLTAPLTPLFDPDEGYYPATAAESVDAGAGWDLQFNGAPRWDKPVLSYALIESSFAVFGRSVTAARLPSAIQGALLVLVVGVAVGRVSTARAATLSAIVLATSVGLQIFARVAHPEVAVVLWITVAELSLALYLMTRDASQRVVLAMLAGAAMGCGILAKGPVAIVLPLLAAVATMAITRDARWSWRTAARDAAAAIAVALVVAMPWYVAMTLRHGREFLAEAIWAHNVSRYAGTAFVHRSSIAGLVVPVIVAMMPWTAFLPSAGRAVRATDRSDAGILRLMMASAAVTSFLFYSASASKLPHYALVVVPSLAVLIGIDLDERLRARETAGREAWFTAGVLASTAAMLAAVPWLMNRLFSARDVLGGAPGDGSTLHGLIDLAVWPSALLLVMVAIVIVRFRRLEARIATVTVIGVAAPLVLIACAQPLLQAVYPWERFAKEIRVTALPIWMIGPRAPSLAFYASRPVLRIGEDELAESTTLPVEAWIVADTNALRRSAPRLPSEQITIVDRFGTMALAHLTVLQAHR